MADSIVTLPTPSSFPDISSVGPTVTPTQNTNSVPVNTNPDGYTTPPPSGYTGGTTSGTSSGPPTATIHYGGTSNNTNANNPGQGPSSGLTAGNSSGYSSQPTGTTVGNSTGSTPSVQQIGSSGSNGSAASGITQSQTMANIVGNSGNYSSNSAGGSGGLSGTSSSHGGGGGSNYGTDSVGNPGVYLAGQWFPLSVVQASQQKPWVATSSSGNGNSATVTTSNTPTGPTTQTNTGTPAPQQPPASAPSSGQPATESTAPPTPPPTQPPSQTTNSDQTQQTPSLVNTGQGIAGTVQLPEGVRPQVQVPGLYHLAGVSSTLAGVSFASPTSVASPRPLSAIQNLAAGTFNEDLATQLHEWFDKGIAPQVRRIPGKSGVIRNYDKNGIPFGAGKPGAFTKVFTPAKTVIGGLSKMVPDSALAGASSALQGVSGVLSNLPHIVEGNSDTTPVPVNTQGKANVVPLAPVRQGFSYANGENSLQPLMSNPSAGNSALDAINAATNSTELAADTIQGFEGFSTRAYWDVNHWRTGYGSDTWTDENGRVHNVTRNTRVTREQARADILRRTREFQRGIIRSVGQEAWDNLPVDAQAAITSVAYNYGSLTNLHTLRSAIRSGDLQAIAQAIADRAHDNGGVNARRRNQEAQMVLNAGTHPTPSVNVPSAGTTMQTAQNTTTQPSPRPAPAGPSPNTTPKAPSRRTPKTVTVDNTRGPTVTVDNGADPGIVEWEKTHGNTNGLF